MDYEEFEAFVAKNNLSKANPEETSEEMRDAFQVFDKDGNGFIDVKEFREVMTTIGETDFKTLFKALLSGTNFPVVLDVLFPHLLSNRF